MIFTTDLINGDLLRAVEDCMGIEKVQIMIIANNNNNNENRDVMIRLHFRCGNARISCQR